MSIADTAERDRFDALTTEFIERTHGNRPTPDNPDGFVAGALISAAVLHGVGSRMGGAGAPLVAAANEFASVLLDEHCGTPPGPHPHGPGPRLIASLSEVVAVLPPNSEFARSLRGIAFAAAARTLGFRDAGSDPMPAYGG